MFVSDRWFILGGASIYRIDFKNVTQLHNTGGRNQIQVEEILQFFVSSCGYKVESHNSYQIFYCGFMTSYTISVRTSKKIERYDPPEFNFNKLQCVPVQFIFIEFLKVHIG